MVLAKIIRIRNRKKRNKTQENLKQYIMFFFTFLRFCGYILTRTTLYKYIFFYKLIVLKLNAKRFYSES